MFRIARPYRFSRKTRAVFLLLLSLLLIELYQSRYRRGEKSILVVDQVLQAQIDSLQEVAYTLRPPYPFNPNYLSEASAYFMGIPPEALDRLYAYRKSGK